MTDAITTSGASLLVKQIEDAVLKYPERKDQLRLIKILKRIAKQARSIPQETQEFLLDAIPEPLQGSRHAKEIRNILHSKEEKK